MRRCLFAAAFGLILILQGCLQFQAQETRLERAVADCRDERGVYMKSVSVEDDGATVAMISSLSRPGGLRAISCILLQVKTPESIIASIAVSTTDSSVGVESHKGLVYVWGTRSGLLHVVVSEAPEERVRH